MADELEIIKLQLSELKESVGKLNERFSGLGKVVIEKFTNIEKLVELTTKPAQPENPHLNQTDLLCPQCGKGLSQRQGKFGPFMGCTGYPTCKFILKEPKR
jgi:ssDNA-binding Zn-finger/Zn-ribbon topoisomerase 1